MSDEFYIIVDDTFGPYKHCKECGTLWTDVLLRCPHCGSQHFKFARKEYEDSAHDRPAALRERTT